MTIPTFTTPSANNSSAAFTKNVFGTYTIVATGSPVPAMTIKGSLPAGLTFVDHGNGTATISGTPIEDGAFQISIRATNTAGRIAWGLNINIPKQLPLIQSRNHWTAAASTVQNIATPLAFARGNAVRFTQTGLPSTVGLSSAGVLFGHCNTPGVYVSTFTATDSLGNVDTQTFYLVIVGAGSCPPDPIHFITNQVALPDPTGAILSAFTGGGAFWDGGGACYVVPDGIDFGDLAINNFEVRNADFFSPHLPGTNSPLSTNSDYQAQGIKPIIRRKDCDSVTLTNVRVWGSNGGVTGYHAPLVGQGGFLEASSTNCTTTKCEAHDTCGDGLTVVGDYAQGGGPTTGLTVNGFITFNAGRQGTTFAYCFDSTINDVTEINSTEGTIDLESDVGGPSGSVGCSNVTFNRMVGNSGPRIIEPLQGPLFFNDCNFGGGISLTNAAAQSGQPVRFTRCQFAIKRVFSGSPPAGVNVNGPGSLTLDHCAINRQPGTVAPTGPAWSVLNGGTLTLIDTPYQGAAGVTDSGLGSQVLIEDVDAPSFPSPTVAFNLVVGQNMGAYPISFGGNPSPVMTHSGSLPPGTNWYYNNIVGTPAPGSAGTYTVTVTATNIHGSASQVITITVVNPTSAPVFTTPATGQMMQNQGSSIQVKALGNPAPIIDLSGALPHGVFWVFNCLAGTPDTFGTFPLTLTAHNGIGSPVVQNFVLTVIETDQTLPVFKTDDVASWVQGTGEVFPISVIGTPNPVLSVSGALPRGVFLAFNTLAGTPTETGTFHPTLIATNEVGTATQALTITVAPEQMVPRLILPPFLAMTRGTPADIALAWLMTGNPPPVLTMTGTLPPGVAYQDGSLVGTPRATGDFPLVFTATNALGQVSENVTLQVARRNAQSTTTFAAPS